MTNLFLIIFLAASAGFTIVIHRTSRAAWKTRLFAFLLFLFLALAAVLFLLRSYNQTILRVNQAYEQTKSHDGSS
jgi:hypothetical protein